MTTVKNVQVRLASRPSGMPTSDNFQITQVQQPLEPSRGVRLKTIWLSIDPYMRARMSSRPSYTDPTGIGDIMPRGTVSQVIASKQSGYRVGDFVVGYTGWRAYADSDGSGLRKLDPTVASVSTALGGCDSFIARYGRDTCIFVNTLEGKRLRLRGIYGRVIRDGRLAVGDTVRKVTPKDLLASGSG